MGRIPRNVPKATRMFLEVVLVLSVFESNSGVLLSPNDPVPNDNFIIQLGVASVPLFTPNQGTVEGNRFAITHAVSIGIFCCQI